MASELGDRETWDMAPPPTPTRSRLYALAPIGIGTPYVESMTSYLMRLADEYAVPVQVLIRQEFGGHLQRAGTMLTTSTRAASYIRTVGHVVNGKDGVAEDMCRVAESLTSRRDLHFLSFLTWSDVLSSARLVRRHHAWCDVCLDHWKDVGETVYEPLLWSVADVTICPIHHCPLQERCPHPDCGQTTPVLASHVRPGHCATCRRWTERQAAPDIRPVLSLPDDAKWQLWVAQTVGKLLSDMPSLSRRPSLQWFSATLRRYRELRRSIYAVGRFFDVSDASVKRWQEGSMPLRLLEALRICYRLDVSPSDLFTSDPERIALPLPFKGAAIMPLRTPRRPYRSFDVALIQTQVAALLASLSTPPPLEAVCRRIGYRDTYLRKYLPDLCREIVANHRAYRRERKRQRLCDTAREIWRVCYSLHRAGTYPSAVRVIARVTVPLNFSEPEVYAIWLRILEALGWSLDGVRIPSS